MPSPTDAYTCIVPDSKVYGSPEPFAAEPPDEDSRLAMASRFRNTARASAATMSTITRSTSFLPRLFSFFVSRSLKPSPPSHCPTQQILTENC